MGLWLFIFEPGGAIRHVPQRIANGLHLGEPPLPEYAGSRVRYALVFVAVENRRRLAITRIDSGYFSFDETGNPQRGLAYGGAAARVTFKELEKETPTLADLRREPPDHHRHPTMPWQPGEERPTLGLPLLR